MHDDEHRVVDSWIRIPKRVGSRDESLHDRAVQLLPLRIAKDFDQSSDPMLESGCVLGRRGVKKLFVIVPIDVPPDGGHWIAVLDSTALNESKKQKFGEIRVGTFVPVSQAFSAGLEEVQIEKTL